MRQTPTTMNNNLPSTLLPTKVQSNRCLADHALQMHDAKTASTSITMMTKCMPIDHLSTWSYHLTGDQRQHSFYSCCASLNNHHTNDNSPSSPNSINTGTTMIHTTLMMSSTPLPTMPEQPMTIPTLQTALPPTIPPTSKTPQASTPPNVLDMNDSQNEGNNLWCLTDKKWMSLTIQTMSLHWQNNSNQIDVLGCNKATTMTAKQMIEKHQMNLQKGAGGQKFH